MFFEGAFVSFESSFLRCVEGLAFNHEKGFWFRKKFGLRSVLENTRLVFVCNGILKAALKKIARNHCHQGLTYHSMNYYQTQQVRITELNLFAGNDRHFCSFSAFKNVQEEPSLSKNQFET